MQPPAAGADTDGEVPVIDRRRIAQLLELQDEEQPRLLADIVELFLTDSPRHLEALAEAIRSGDHARLESTAHRLLSGIGNIGARRMSTHCMELERLGRAGTVTGAEQVLEQLKLEFALAREPLAAIVAKPE
jgi:HPt (histidine-containing phosphotransfer) domain-containing protein